MAALGTVLRNMRNTGWPVTTCCLLRLLSCLLWVKSTVTVQPETSQLTLMSWQMKLEISQKADSCKTQIRVSFPACLLLWVWKEIQLTLEQHGFELWGSIYLRILLRPCGELVYLTLAFSAINSNWIEFFFFFLTFGHPMTYGNPRPGIRCKPQLQQGRIL